MSRCGLARTVIGSDAFDLGSAQGFARQIEAPDAGVLVEIAQDVGELQRAAEVMRQRPAVARRSMPNTRTDSRPTALATRSQ